MTRNAKNARKQKSNAPSLIAYAVSEKGEDKAFWTRIGAAWDHEDGEGLTLQLELLPVSGGRIVLRAPKEESGEGKSA
jgi:hypothetical protein